jgi:hypothetical protein
MRAAAFAVAQGSSQATCIGEREEQRAARRQVGGGMTPLSGLVLSELQLAGVRSMRP